MKTARILLIVLLLACSVLACVDWTGGGGGDDTPSWQRSINATCTYGAGEWFAQMTAEAVGGVSP